ncbi:MAG: hypothetical protein ABI759_07355 [Candidatus Solibacter sp.]
MIRVLVIHREPEEGVALASRLRSLGFDATAYLSVGPSGFRSIRQDPPQVILIDLTRLPSYGKTMGVLLRHSKSLRTIPLVFIEGDPAKAAQVRGMLPDAGFTVWAKMPAVIRKAAAAPPLEPLPPPPHDTPLLQKLGVREGSKVAILHAPGGFALPGVKAQKQVADADVVLIFHRTSATLLRALPEIAGMMRTGRRVWIVWPKKAAGRQSDLTMPRIREMASDFGLVDYKVCAVDATWSAMTLGRRQA